MHLNRNILLVDDHAYSREHLKEILRARGATVVGEARNTDDALEKVQQLQPDTVILDVCIPGSWDALVTIRQIRRLEPACTVLVTGTPSQNLTLMEALSMGAVDFVLKPFHARSVELCLERNLA
jgi:DNA-binding NarL/FixJ family response regulator